jgi:CSLREA domain-containing protein
MLEAGRYGMLRRGALRLARPVFLAALLVLPIQPALEAAANTIAVNTLVDDNSVAPDGLCSLREAINSANMTGGPAGSCTSGSGNDTINFSVSGLITLVVGSLPAIVNTLTIDGGQIITVDGAGLYGVFAVNVGATLTLGNLTIQHGLAASSGGAISNAGTLMVFNSALQNNKANAIAGNGGGIDNTGTLTVTNSTFSNNAAPAGNGGAIDGESGALTVNGCTFSLNTASGNGGAIDSATGDTAVPIVTNSTFSANQAGSVTGEGGGIYSSAGTATVINSTFSSNSASSGGGVYNAGGTFTVTNSILADSAQGSSTCSTGPGCNCFGTTDGGYNISANPTGSDSSCVFAGTGANQDPIGNDVSDTNLALGPLASNGGPTQTMAPQLTALTPNLISYAIDAVPLSHCVPPTYPNTDQRGLPRPAPGFNACDIGAYEGAYEFQTQLTVPNVPATAGAAFNVSATLSPVGSGLCGEGQIIFTFQGNVQAATTSGGVANTFFFAPTIGGIYELQASYSGGGAGSPCGPANATALITVPGPSGAAATSLTVGNVIASPGSSFVVTATLSSSTSACTADQSITFLFQNVSVTATTGPNGVASATYTAPFSGGASFSVVATFAGNSSCAPSPPAGAVVILSPATTSALTVQNITVSASTPTFNPTATLSSNATACSISGQSVNFLLLSSPAQSALGTTNTSGMVPPSGPGSVTFTTPSTPGTYTIQASFSPVSQPVGCGGSTGSGLLIVTAVPSSATATAMTVANVTAPEGATFTAAAELVSSSSACTSQTITFAFLHTQLAQATNPSGVANVTLAAPTTPGVYPIVASFAGNSLCGPSSNTGQVTVPAPTPTTLTMPDVTARPATLFTAKANLAPASCAGGQNISFMFNGSTRTSFTNLYGQATTSYVASGMTGPATIQASFAGTPYCAPISTSATLHVQGASGPPILNVLPGSVSFGSDPLGGSSLQIITVANEASTPANVSSITIANAPGTSGTPFTESDNCVPTVGPHSQCSINVGYAPTVAARQTASLQIHLNNNTASKTVPLSGTGIVVASAVPSRISYGSQKRGTVSNSSQVTVTNNLTGGLAIANISASGDFVVTKNGCANVLKSRSSCKIKVAFEPTASGTLKGSLTIIDTVSPVPLTVTLIGTGH